MPEPPASHRSDALDRLTGAVQELSKKLDDASERSNSSIRSLRTRQRGMSRRLREHVAQDVEFHGDLKDRAESAAKQHVTDFRQTAEIEAKHEQDLAAVVIGLDDTRKLAKKCLEQVDEVKKAQALTATETALQTPVLAKVDTQTSQMSTPTKAAALLNLVIGLVYLFCELLKALGKHP